MISIRNMSAKDIEGVLGVEREAFSTPWTERLFYDELENPHTVYYVCLDGEDIIGYGGLWHVLDEGQITNIAVRKSHHRRGVGSMLLENLIEYAKNNGLSRLELEVRAGNAAAISLYKKYGFSEVGQRRGYYRNPTEDALLMDLQTGRKE